jgi:hypothetical protein
MTAFAVAIDLLFADPNLAHEAWHRDSEGQFTRIRIIMRRNDDVTNSPDSKLHQAFGREMGDQLAKSGRENRHIRTACRHATGRSPHR